MKENKLWAERHSLINQLPLNTPLGVHLCASTFCNFRCEYCPHVNDDMDGGNTLTKSIKYEMMSLETFRRIVAQLKFFPQKIECINFAWWGEPLTNPHIADMVAMLKEADVAKCISITTNAALLSKSMSDNLISAGLDRMRISLQGLDSETYKKVGGVKIDFDEFVENIRYFYLNKKTTDVYIKIVDSLVQEPQMEARFHELFDSISDYINVECLEPLQNSLDISDMNGKYQKNYYGGENIAVQKICSYCFYQIIVSPQGDIYPCCSIDYEEKDGQIRDIRLSNIWDDSLYDYWNGTRLKEFRRMQINGERFNDSICAKCAFPKYHISDEDRLDDYAERLMNLYM